MTYPDNPPLTCDIVMKGGITSGVIYPQAICELAKTYRLVSVGGSSAGAIAAAGAAAAEFGRATGGFDVLEKLPAAITEKSPAGGSVLFRLFQPTKRAYPLYRALTAGMGNKAKAPRIAGALVVGFWLPALVGMLPGTLLIVVGCFGYGLAVWAAVVGGGVLAAIGAAVGVAWAVLARLAGTVSAGFGLCTGMPGIGAKRAVALAPFLHQQFQTMAGLPEEAVLTFGDLRAKGIDLRVMTTNLTRRQPTPMPWATKEYFFEPDEMRVLFPKEVVEWMVDHPPALAPGPDGKAPSDTVIRAQELLRARAGSKRPWPAPDNVPVIVATRMSLSFPLLITAVALYAVDYSRAANQAAAAAAQAWLRDNPNRPAAEGARELANVPLEFERNWFSDGGICANLPVHFFDTPLPGRPTFAIDLEEFPPDRAKSAQESDNCYLPIHNGEGLLRPWTRLDTSCPTTFDGIKALGSFMSQIVSTARGWLDTAQLVTPGYRDRVVTVYHDNTEGGMNLTMPADVVTELASRGQAAARKLVDKFVGAAGGKPQGWGWNNQRWIRFRTSTAGLSTWLAKFDENYHSATPGTTPRYADLAGLNASAPLPSYPPADRAQLNHLTSGLLGVAATWGPNDALTANTPKPPPPLRLMPDDGADRNPLATATSRAQTTNPPSEEKL
jgi:predicted acylesterase/phospholipase RssA